MSELLENLQPQRVLLQDVPFDEAPHVVEILPLRPLLTVRVVLVFFVVVVRDQLIVVACGAGGVLITISTTLLSFTGIFAVFTLIHFQLISFLNLYD